MPELYVANKVANIAFTGKTLENRILVIKKRYRSKYRGMLSAYDKRGRREAYHYAMGVLELKNEIRQLRDTAMKIKFFVDYTIIQLGGEKVNQPLLDLLVPFNQAAERGSVNKIRSYLIRFGKEFDLSIMTEADPPRHYPELNPIEISPDNAYKELNKAVALRKKKLLKKQMKENNKKSLAEVAEKRNGSERGSVAEP